MQQLVPWVYLCWLGMSLILFSRLPGATATVACLVGGWAFLPTASFTSLDPGASHAWIIGAALPGSFWITKATVIGTGAGLGALLCDWRSLKRYRPRWIDLAIGVWCLLPLASSAANGLPLSAGLAQCLYHVLAWAVAYMLGRVYLSDRTKLDQMAMGLVLAGAAYVPLCLVEFVSGPRLYELIYGLHPYAHDSELRYIGYRPLLFLEHGNQLGIWLASSALVAVWLWRRRAPTSSGRIWRWLAAFALVSVTFLSQSVGAILLLLAGWGLLELACRIPARLLVGVLLAAVVIWSAARFTGTVSATRFAERTRIGAQLKQWLKDVDRGSFGWRLKHEEQHFARARQRLALGWSRWDWWRQPDPSATRPWSFWTLTFGMYGLAGLLAVAVVMFGPVVALAWRTDARRMAEPQMASAAVLGVVLVINFLDAALNSALIVVLTAATGGIVTDLGRSMQRGRQGEEERRSRVES